MILHAASILLKLNEKTLTLDLCCPCSHLRGAQTVCCQNTKIMFHYSSALYFSMFFFLFLLFFYSFCDLQYKTNDIFNSINLLWIFFHRFYSPWKTKMRRCEQKHDFYWNMVNIITWESYYFTFAHLLRWCWGPRRVHQRGDAGSACQSSHCCRA